MNLRQKLANSLAASMTTESEGFAYHLATKIMREFNITEKNSEPAQAGGFNPDDTFSAGDLLYALMQQAI